ncbi:MAG: hypothetical protein ABIL09_02875 [Gemmatimonadota bacterium]
MARPRLSLGPLLLALAALGLSVAPAAAADLAGAYLETGMGSAGLGLGGAFSAVVQDPTAAYWNPAGLARLRGRSLVVGYLPLSLDRTQASLAGAANLRGGLGFAFAWIHAGVDGIQGRTNSGEVFGEIVDAENAAFFALGLSPAPGLRLGAAAKVLRQSVDVDQIGASTATGHGLDLGLQYDLGQRTHLAAGARNLLARLQWTVARPNSQTSRSEDPLPVDLYAGAAHQPLPAVTLAAEVHTGNVGTYAGAGGAWVVNPLLTLRAGLSRIGLDEGAGSLTAGVSLRPMRSDVLELQYAYADDPAGDGARLAVGLATRF